MVPRVYYHDRWGTTTFLLGNMLSQNVHDTGLGWWDPDYSGFSTSEFFLRLNY